ncbi:hypothetical protein GCM10027280_43240 [Micromonospora polyrhachis]|uniref:Uncharacterized protein n=1 Tax=Micromonospora polyrhachis TaxID=1282883 RepID=A0A7W7SWA6_9ACTN|nr:hypothetical protein [Micromonospora polyrhachis]MBB4962143.1 hypothetical protein [Micromonospora polyrhachis]
MASHEPSDRDRRDPIEARRSWIERRRQKIIDEVARNRRGEYTVPTWVLAAALVLIVGGWLALIFMV